jgi:hypothetical protein
MKPQKFTGEEGTFISTTVAKEHTKRFHDKKKKEGKESQTYTEAQFFGKKQLQKLLGKEGCVGLRFYFSASQKDQFDDGLVIVAVDEDGKDLTSTRIGLKDMPVADEDALVDGPICPHDCNP